MQQLRIPQVIVMREPVPDQVAHAFLTHFLSAFAQGQSLYLAVRAARLRLEELQNRFPAASSLPVICQNPAVEPLNWQALGRRPTEKCPYLGLFTFQEKDAPFFYGREEFTTTLAEILQRQSLVSVIGASGSGKSSVIAAGLVPLLRQRSNEAWRIATFRPGTNPFNSLAKTLLLLSPNQTPGVTAIAQLAKRLRQEVGALSSEIEKIVDADANCKVLLIADQFEELYTLCPDTQDQEVFLNQLLQATEQNNFKLLLSLRADFLGQALSYAPFTAALQQSSVMLGSMSRSELRSAITKPAALLQVTLEEGLVERMIESVSSSTSNLPLLEFALQELWKKRQQTLLTHAAYEEIGGVEAAIARYAERVYNKLNESEKDRSCQIFLQLVRPGEGTVDTRRVATRAEIGDENWELVTRLASDRLVVTGQDITTSTETVELVHEALILQWSRLGSWIEENRDFRFWQEGLRSAMQQWGKSDQDEGALLRGKPLVDAENWLQKRPKELTAEQEFVKASSAQHKKQKRQRILMFGSISAGALLLTITAGIATWQTNTAKANAQLRELAATSEALSRAYQQTKNEEKYGTQPSNSLLTKEQYLEQQRQNSIDRYQDALVAALRAGKELQQTTYSVDLNTRFQVLTALNQAVYAGKFGPEVNLSECGFMHKRTSISMSVDRKIIACANSDGTMRLSSSITGKKSSVFKGDANWVNDIRFSPDGKTMASGTVEGDVKLWNRATNKVIKTLKGHLSEVNSLDFSPDGRTVAAGNFDGTITFWNTETGQETKTLNGHSEKLYQVRFSPDAQMMVSVGNDRKVKLWNLQTDKAFKTLSCEDCSRTKVSFSFDNQNILHSKYMSDIVLWDIKADRAIKTIKEKDNEQQFSPDGKIVASGVAKSGNNTVILRDISTGQILKTLNAQAGKLSSGELKWDKIGGSGSRVNSIGFSSNSNLIAVASADRTMTLWDSSNGTKLKTFQGLTEWTGNITFSLNSKLIATTGMDSNNRESEVKLWDITTGELLKTLIKEPVSRPGGISREVRFSLDNQTIAVVSSDNTVRLWNISTGQELNILGLTNSNPLNHPQILLQKNKIIATKMPDGRVRRLERSTGKELEPLYWHKMLASDVQFSDDGKTIAVVNWDGEKKVRDVATGQELNSVRLGFPFSSTIDFSDDISMIAVATRKGVKIWNTSTNKEISSLNLKGDPKKSDDGVIEGLSFSPDGKTIMTIDNVVQQDAQKKTSEQQIIKLWNVQSGKTIETFKAQLNSANDVAFSPDNQTIAFARSDGSIELWDFLTGKEITTLKRHLKQVDRINFSSDGKMLLSTTGTGFSVNEMKLWDLTTGQAIKTYKQDTGERIPGITSSQFSRDNKTIFLLSDDKVISWNLDLEDLLKRGCDQVQNKTKAKNICNNSFKF